MICSQQLVSCSNRLCWFLWHEHWLHWTDWSQLADWGSCCAICLYIPGSYCKDLLQNICTWREDLCLHLPALIYSNTIVQAFNKCRPLYIRQDRICATFAFMVWLLNLIVVDCANKRFCKFHKKTGKVFLLDAYFSGRHCGGLIISDWHGWWHVDRLGGRSFLKNKVSCLIYILDFVEMLGWWSGNLSCRWC